MAYDPSYMKGENLPNQTLYVYNLDDKINTNDLVKLLYELFVPYGEVVDIHARRTNKLRGQAFVAFREISSATAAIKGVKDRVFLNRPIKVAYARKASYKAMKPTECYRLVSALRQRLSQAEEPQEHVATHDPSSQSYTLVVENLHPEMNKVAVELLFKQYPGYKDCRFVEGKCIAFVDFSTLYQGEVALQGLQGFKVSHTHELRISFAK